jgi:hypothetical protein
MAKIREATCMLLDSAEDGCVSWETIARAALGYMSEDDVRDMCEKEDFPCPWQDDDEDDPCGDEDEIDPEPWAHSPVLGYNR